MALLPRFSFAAHVDKPLNIRHSLIVSHHDVAPQPAGTGGAAADQTAALTGKNPAPTTSGDRSRAKL